MKRFFIGLMALMVSVTLFAAPRTAEQAAVLAAQFTNQQTQVRHLRRAPLAASEMRLVHQTNKPASNEAALYVFNQRDNGFVIVSGDDNAVTILGYSDEGTFDAENIPSNVQFWLDFCAERIADAQPQSGRQIRKAQKVQAISKLLGNIQWNQGAPYNDLCPMDKKTKAYTGCVATAAAQIMKMYNWPVTGQGSHTDNWTSDAGKSGSSYADFGGTTYDWTNMLDKYTSSNYNATQANAVATLMFHVGVSCDMQYGGDESNGSGAYTNDMGNALVSYFRYKNTAKYKSGLSTSQLTSLFNTELEAGRPILMGGGNSSGGHEFVCDGRDEDGLFHINWGWGGMSDGFFALNGLDPDHQGAGGSSAGYNQQIDCVVGIEPDRNPVSVTGVTVDPTSATIKQKERLQMSATVLPDSASNKGLSWSTSNAAVATVGASGIVTGVSQGTATITAKTNDGNKTATCQITVTDEVASATELVVDFGYAEYSSDDQQWTLVIYESSTQCPWIQYYIPASSSTKIAGTYDLAENPAGLWNDPNDENAYVQTTSGQLNVTCVGKDNGANGCNTYQIRASFTCNDGMEYVMNTTLEMCAQDDNNPANAIDLTDNVGDGQPIEITWIANGDDFAANVAVNGKITLPTDKPVNCESGKVFVGWSKTEFDETDVAPTFAKTGDAVTANTTYYAVYATAESGSSTPAEVASVTFKTAASDASQDISSDIKNKIVQSESGISAYSGEKVYAGKEGAKLGTSSAAGNITITLPSALSVTQVTVNASKYGSDTGKLRVTAGSTTLGEDKSPAANLVFTAESPVETNTITVATTSKRAYVASITVTAGGGTSYSAYATTCGAPAEKYAINLAEVAHGTIATSPANQAAAGRTVTITATPEQFYQVASISVKAADNSDVTVTNNTFVMPAQAVTVSATFELQDKVAVKFYDKGQVISNEQYFIGQTAVAPADPTACDNYSFAGWWTAELAEDNTEAKAWITNFTVTGEKNYYAIYSKTEVGEGGSVAFDGQTPGNYKIYAQAGETKYYAKNEVNTSYKLESTTDEILGATFTFATSGNGFTISVGDQYLKYTSGTNINLAADPYTWTVESGVKGTWRLVSETSGRALIFRKTTNYQTFGGYSTGNVTASGTEYYDLEIEGGEASITYYSSNVTCETTAIDKAEVTSKAIKVLENGQIIIIFGNEKYTIFGQKIQ